VATYWPADSGRFLVIVAVAFYVKGFNEFKNGDVDIGYNYKGVRMISNRSYRIALVLAVAGVALFGCSFPVDKEKNDKDSP